jgi:CheY-like chemotaxis protein
MGRQELIELASYGARAGAKGSYTIVFRAVDGPRDNLLADVGFHEGSFMGESSRRSSRILFVDDDDLIVRLTAVTLGRAGHKVSSFSDPGAALEAFRTAPDAFDLVVCDIQLGNLSGVELAAHMLCIRPGTPIVLTSEMILQEDRERALGAGVRAILPKAKVMVDLATVVQQILY